MLHEDRTRASVAGALRPNINRLSLAQHAVLLLRAGGSVGSSKLRARRIEPSSSHERQSSSKFHARLRCFGDEDQMGLAGQMCHGVSYLSDWRIVACSFGRRGRHSPSRSDSTRVS